MKTKLLKAIVTFLPVLCFAATASAMDAETIKDLPEGATWHEIEERIRFLAAIEKAREEVRRGQVVPHEEVRNLLSGWLSK